MPRTRKGSKEAAAEEPKPPEIDFYLEDRHPNPKAMNVWEFMQALTEEQWGDYIGYLYRVGPKKIPTDRYKYIAVVTAPITKEEIKHLYGGKKFTLHFNRRLGKRQVATHNPEQFDIEAEPIWQDGELPIAPPSGGRASSAAGADPNSMNILTDLIRDLVAQNAEAQRNGQPFDTSAAITEALKIQSKGATSAIDIIAAQAQGGGSKGDDKLLGLLVDDLIQRARKPDKGTSAIEEIRAVLELTKELRPEGGGGGTDNVWVALAQSVGPKLDTVLERLAGIVQNYAIIAMSKNPAALAQLQKARPPGATATAAAPSEAATPAANPQPTQEQIDRFRRSVITDQLKKTIVQMLFAGDSGEAAAEVAEKMDEEWADEFAGVLRRDIASLASDPILAPAVTAPRLADFTQEFLGYFEMIEGTKESNEPEPAASPAA